MAAVFTRLMPLSASGFMSRSLTKPSKTIKTPPIQDHMSSDSSADGGMDEPEDDDDDESVEQVQDIDMADADDYFEPDAEDSGEESIPEEGGHVNENTAHKRPARSTRAATRRVPARARKEVPVEDDSSVTSEDQSSSTSSEVEAQWDRELPTDGDGNAEDEEEQIDPSRCM